MFTNMFLHAQTNINTLLYLPTQNHRKLKKIQREIFGVSKFDNSFILRQAEFSMTNIFQDFLRFFFTKKLIFFLFVMILSRYDKRVFLFLFEHANTRKHVYEHSCSCVRVILSILAHLAQFFFLISM